MACILLYIAGSRLPKKILILVRIFKDNLDRLLFRIDWISYLVFHWIGYIKCISLPHVLQENNLPIFISSSSRPIAGHQNRLIILFAVIYILCIHSFICVGLILIAGTFFLCMFISSAVNMVGMG